MRGERERVSERERERERKLERKSKTSIIISGQNRFTDNRFKVL